MARPKNGRGKSLWPKILGAKPSEVIQAERIVVAKIAALLGVEELIRARFSGNLHVVFEKGLPLRIAKQAAQRVSQ